jgi:protein TonB
MFDLITGNVTHAPRPRATPVMVSIAVHATLVGAVLVGTLLFVSAPVPEPPMVMAFVAPSPPPPPPPAPRERVPEKRETPKPATTSGDVAPIAPPSEIGAEPAIEDEEEVGRADGGVADGITGGVMGGVIAEIPPPPPPPPPPPEAPRGPVRVGGQIKEPTLIHRVDPEYPLLAQISQIEGVVILEAIVDREGRIESLKVLRSVPVFEQAALAAVRQWRYSPVILNGRPERFILTVVVSFRLEK